MNSINNILKPKTIEESLLDLFKGTFLEKANSNDVFYSKIYGVIGSSGEQLLKDHNITYVKTIPNKYIHAYNYELSAPLINYVKYFITLGWSANEIKEYLNDNLTYEA
jgi:hypothetical protein